MRGMAHLDTHDVSGTVLLAGSGRSGTTWLGQIINHGNTYRDVFEPFHPERNPALNGWPVMRYLPRDATLDNQSTGVIRGVLAGRVRSSWTDASNRKTFAKQRLIKTIRANLMLGYIRQHHPRVSLLFALRHPCAVAHSRLKLGWDTHLDQLLDQPALMRDHLEPFRDTIERSAFYGDSWDRHLTMWCIENIVPLRQLKAGQVHVIMYERACSDFDGEAKALFHFLERDVPSDIDRARQKQSAHFRRDSAILRGGDLLSDWQSRVSTHQIDRSLALLSTFGLDHLYDERAMPRCSRDHVFIDSNSADQTFTTQRDAA